MFLFNTADGIQYGACSHIGRRKENQDDIRLPEPSENSRSGGRLFAVADGMGGNQGGRIASRMACKGLSEYRFRLNRANGRQSGPVLKRHLEETVLHIDRRIRLSGRKNPVLEEMGTTLSCLVLTNRHALIAHVGDSRIYRLREEHLTCLTIDHTFVQDMIFEGEVDPEKANSHPLRHMLTRALGAMEPLEQVDTRIDSRRPGDRYLLCTDGLYNTLGDERMAVQLASDRNASQIADTLVEEAVEMETRDNATAVVIIP